LNIVVLQADERQFGLVVAGINDTEEIVVKPLGKQLKGIPVFAGATIMGDGRVALILDVLGIAQKACVVSLVRDRTRVDKTARAADQQERCQTLLLFSLGQGRRLAIPLSLVARLEEIPTATLEHADNEEVVQYRGQIMPLIRLADLFDAPDTEARAGEVMQVVVYTHQGRSVGLVVGRILDIVETIVEVQRTGRRPGLLGSAIIQQHITDLVDVQEIIRTAQPSSYETGRQRQLVETSDVDELPPLLPKRVSR
jgi:two-component system chemotaxis sensor kinase CheA